MPVSVTTSELLSANAAVTDAAADTVHAPVPLQPHAFVHGFLDMRMEPLGDDWWRLHSHARGAAPSFDFNLNPAYAVRLAPS